VALSVVAPADNFKPYVPCDAGFEQLSVTVIVLHPVEKFAPACVWPARHSPCVAIPQSVTLREEAKVEELLVPVEELLVLVEELLVPVEEPLPGAAASAASGRDARLQRAHSQGGNFALS